MLRYRQFWDTEYSREGSIGAYVKASYMEALSSGLFNKPRLENVARSTAPKEATAEEHRQQKSPSPFLVPSKSGVVAGRSTIGPFIMACLR